MTAYNWAVVGVHVEDAKLTPVELFEEYEDARESMLCRIHTLVDESGLASYIDDCGQDVDVYLGGKDCYYGGAVSWKWNVKPVYCEYARGGEDAAPIFMLFNLPKGEPATRGHLRLLDAIGCNHMKRDC